MNQNRSSSALVNGPGCSASHGDSISSGVQPGYQSRNWSTGTISATATPSAQRSTRPDGTSPLGPHLAHAGASSRPVLTVHPADGGSPLGPHAGGSRRRQHAARRRPPATTRGRHAGDDLGAPAPYGRRRRSEYSPFPIDSPSLRAPARSTLVLWGSWSPMTRAVGPIIEIAATTGPSSGTWTGTASEDMPISVSSTLRA